MMFFFQKVQVDEKELLIWAPLKVNDRVARIG